MRWMVRGDFQRAAECLREANARTLARARPSDEYSPESHQKFVERLIREFNGEFLARLRGAGSETRRPVFVFGMPRSGTTLVEQVLASHSEIHGAGELRLARESFDAVPDVAGRTGGPFECLPHLDAAALQELAQRHSAGLEAIDGDASPRIVDKMPDNYLYLGLLTTMFPRLLSTVAATCGTSPYHAG